MTVMVKTILATASLVIAAALLTGCGEAPPDTNQAASDIKAQGKNLPEAPKEVTEGGIMRGGAGDPNASGGNSQLDPNARKNTGN